MSETFGSYRILDRLGANGVGDVYRARDTRAGRTVALTIVSAEIADDPARRDHFLRDARAAATLSHPNIAALYEVAEDESRLALASEYVAGDKLATLVAGHPLNARRAVHFGIQLADALADAHAAGIVHGDLEPEQIVVTSKGSIRVLDVGLARWTRGAAARDGAMRSPFASDAVSTERESARLTPEPVREDIFDPRPDIFSLGSVLFEMLTGRPAFEGGGRPPALARESAKGIPPPVSAINPLVPREVDPIVAKALSNVANDRYESAAILAADLRSLAEVLDSRAKQADGEIARTRPEAARPSAIGWAMGAVVLAMIAWVIWMAMR